MFCPKCGTQCEDNAVFCGNCGTSLVEAATPETVKEEVVANETAASDVAKEENVANETVAPVAAQGESVAANESTEVVKPQPIQVEVPAKAAKKEKQPMPKWLKILIPAAAGAVVVMAAIIALVVAIIGTGNYKKVAKNFMKAYVAGDYDKAYELMNKDLTDYEKMSNPTAYAYVNNCANEFLTKDSFRATRAGNSIMEIKNIKVADLSAKNADNKSVAVTYTTQIGTMGYETLTLTEKKKPGFLKAKYGVSLNSFVADDVVVRVPVGSKLYINGQEVSEGYIDDSMSSSKAYSYYVIEKLFTGEHLFKITGDAFEDFEMTSYVSDGSSVYFNSSDIKVKQTTIDNLKTQAQSDLEKIKTAALAKKDASEIKSLCAPAYESNVNSDYKYYAIGDMHTSTKTYKSLSISDVKAEAKSTTYSVNSDGYQTLTIKLSYKLSGDYDYKGYFSTSTTNYKGTGSTSSSYIVYTLQDGKWGISDFNLEFYIS